MPDGDQNSGGASQNQSGDQGGQQQQSQQNGGQGGSQQQQQSQAPTWDSLKTHIPKEYAQEKMWENVKDVPTLLKNYAESQKYIGGSIKIPVEGKDGQDAFDKFYEKLGRPNSADGYKFEMPEIANGVEWDKDAISAFAKFAHANGLSAKQAQGVLNGYAEMVKGHVQSRTAQTKTTLEALEKEIGPGYQKELAYGQAAIKQIGGQEVVDAINQTGLGNNVPFIKMMIAIGRQLGEDSIIDVESIRSSERDAQSRIDAIMKDPKHAYFNAQDPAHDRAVQEVSRLFGMLHPGNVSVGQVFRA